MLKDTFLFYAILDPGIAKMHNSNNGFSYYTQDIGILNISKIDTAAIGFGRNMQRETYCIPYCMYACTT